jgi:hypothetical protein
MPVKLSTYQVILLSTWVFSTKLGDEIPKLMSDGCITDALLYLSVGGVEVSWLDTMSLGNT